MTKVTEQAEASSRPVGEHVASDGAAGAAWNRAVGRPCNSHRLSSNVPGVTAREGLLHAAGRSRVARLFRG